MMLRKHGAILLALWVGLYAYACNPNESETYTAALGGKADQAGLPSEGMNWAQIEKRCQKPAADEPIIYSDDFQWGISAEAMAQSFEKIYYADKRLSGRAYYDEETRQYLLPSDDSQGGPVVLSPRLIENVRRHIEKALLRGYADYVFFPDMGHSHLFIPEDRWEEEYKSTPVSKMSSMYSRLFDDPELLVLYHTAEQLQMLDEDSELLNDRHLRWRFFTRNVVGDNAYLARIDLLHEPTHSSNTSRKLAGHQYHGSGFGISANKDGCFPYVVGEFTYWFDISLSDPPPSEVGVDF